MITSILSSQTRLHSIADANTWLNAFSLVVAIALAAFCFLDFWLGRRRRKQLLSDCRRWLRDLRSITYPEVYLVHAVKVAERLEQWFGNPWTGPCVYRTDTLHFNP